MWYTESLYRIKTSVEKAAILVYKMKDEPYIVKRPIKANLRGLVESACNRKDNKGEPVADIEHSTTAEYTVMKTPCMTERIHQCKTAEVVLEYGAEYETTSGSRSENCQAARNTFYSIVAFLFGFFCASVAYMFEYP